MSIHLINHTEFIIIIISITDKYIHICTLKLYYETLLWNISLYSTFKNLKHVNNCYFNSVRYNTTKLFLTKCFTKNLKFHTDGMNNLHNYYTS